MRFFVSQMSHITALCKLRFIMINFVVAFRFVRGCFEQSSHLHEAIIKSFWWRRPKATKKDTIFHFDFNQFIWIYWTIALDWCEHVLKRFFVALKLLIIDRMGYHWYFFCYTRSHSLISIMGRKYAEGKESQV